MPRKKTVEFPPLASITIGDISFEIRDGTCPEVGKGSFQRNKLRYQFALVLDWLFEKHIFPNYVEGTQIAPPRCMKSASSLDLELCNSRLPYEYGISEFAIKERIYPALKQEIRILNAAIKNR